MSNESFSEEDFGFTTACEIAKEAMASREFNREESGKVLSEVVRQWPAIYNAGGRRKELVSLVNNIVKAILIVALFITIIMPVGADTFEIRKKDFGRVAGGIRKDYSNVADVKGSVFARTKREGFGAFEAQDTWDEKGKSNIAETLKEIEQVVVKEEKILENIMNVTVTYIHIIENALEHPITTLSKTKTGIVIMVVLVLVLIAGIVRLLTPLFKCIWFCFKIIGRSFWSVINLFLYVLKPTACCMTFCAFSPFVFIRNKIKKWAMDRDDRARLRFSNFGEEVEMLKRTTSKIYTDENGIYLKANESHRIYLNPATQTEDLLLLKSVDYTKRDKEVVVQTIKESILPNSKLYKCPKMPAFQGQFVVDSEVIGHFSRIRFNGKDCIITAYHVLDYNRGAMIHMRKDDKSVEMETVRTKIIAASRTNEFDFVIIEIPSFVFSALGLKVGQWTPRIQKGTSIHIYQLYEGKPAVSQGTLGINESKPWHVKYRASTMSGSSGCPILDSNMRIVGIHLEHDVMDKVNVGIIPPLFRNTRKESPTNEDISQYMPELEELDDSERLDREDEDQYYIYYKKIDSEQAKVERRGNWAEEMDLYEEAMNKATNGEYTRHSEVFMARLKVAKHRNQSMIKRGRVRKESPWTCSVCYCLHKERGYSCANCGMSLIPLKKEKIKQNKEGLKQADSILRDILPLEIREVILKEASDANYIAEIALKVADLLNSKTENLPPNYKQHTIPIEKKMLQSIATKGTYNPLVGVKDDQLTIDNFTLDQAKSDETGAICTTKKLYPLLGVKSIKETISPETTTQSKSSKRRQRRKNKSLTEKPQVPLNSIAPVKTGDVTTSGSKPLTNSQNGQRLSVSPKLNSTQKVRKPNQPSGSSLKKNIPNTKHTPGH